MNNMFRPAVKHESKLRLAIVGPSGSGKTYTSLSVATALANGGKVAVVDTEHGSAEKYSGTFSFDVLQLDAPFHPDRFSDAIQMAAQAGYSVVVLDSLSHAWNGAGGALELVEQFSRKYKGNSYAAWGDVTPIQNRLIESIVGAKLHVIATMRSKQDYILVERNGKQMPQKVGMAPIQRDGFEYEFDVFLDMDVENNAVVTKTRCSELTGKVINRPGVELANTLRTWLSGEPVPEVKQPPVTTTTNGNGHTNGKPAATVTADDLFSEAATPEVIATWRERLTKIKNPTVSTVMSTASGTKLYAGEVHAFNAFKVAFPDMEHNSSARLTPADALVIFNKLVERKADPASEYPLGVDDPASD